MQALFQASSRIKKLIIADEIVIALENLSKDLHFDLDQQRCDVFIQHFISLVKASQFKISFAALNLIPKLIVAVSSAGFSLKQFVNLAPFLVEKLGDSKDRVSKIALDSLLQLMVVMYQDYERSPSNNMIQFVEKLIVAALASKTPKLKETSIEFVLKSANIKNVSLKPFISNLVKLLEDSNETVRLKAKDAVIKLYNEFQNLAIRADIRKEMEKNKTRSSIVDSIVSQFVDEKPDPVQNKDMDQEFVSMKKGSATPEPAPLELFSVKEVDLEISSFLNAFKGKETEENWVARESAIQRLRRIIRGNSYTVDNFINGIKSCIDPLNKTLASLRTALVISVCNAIIDLSFFLRDQIDSVAESIIQALLKTCGSSKKLVASCGLNAIRMILSYTSWNIKYLSIFYTSLSDKNNSIRQTSADGLRLILEQFHSDPELLSILGNDAMDLMEKCIKKCLEDAHSPTREIGKDTFYYLSKGWPKRASKLLELLEPSMQKALARHGSPLATKLVIPTLPDDDDEDESDSHQEHKKVEVAKVTAVYNTIATDSSKKVALTETVSEKKISIEEKIEADLNSKDENLKLDGYYNLLNFLQNKLFKNGATIPRSDLQKLQDAYFNLFETTNEELIANLMLLSYIKILLTSNFVTVSDLLYTMTKLSMKSHNQRDGDLIEFFGFVSETLSLSERLKLVFESLVPSKRRTVSFPNKETRDLENSTSLRLISWILETISDSPTDNEVRLFFSNDTMVRLAINSLLSLYNLKTINSSGRITICSILQTCYQSNPNAFMKTLDTLDTEIASNIRSDLAIDDIGVNPDISYIHENNDISFDMNEENVLDESFPDHFADQSVFRQSLQSPKCSSSGKVSSHREFDQKSDNQPLLHENSARGGLAGIENPIYLSEVQELAENNLITPVRRHFRDLSEVTLFQNSTPNSLHLENDVDNIQEIIYKLAQGDTSLGIIRRLYRLSTEYPYNNPETASPVAINLWSNWGSFLFESIFKRLEFGASDIDEQEICLLLLKHVIHNQFYFLQGNEKNAFKVLFECRSEGSEQISGGADIALHEMHERLDKSRQLSILLDLLKSWNFADESGYAWYVRSSTGNHSQANRFDILRPMVGLSCIHAIGLVSKSCTAEMLEESALWSILLPVAKIAVNSSNIFLRKTTIECLADIANVVGDRIWYHVTGYLNSLQCKLLGVYVLKSRKKMQRAIY